ncbi:MAG TPA: TetR/AcrR family transcriptional regulator [Hyphomicrobiaceae bacterium]|nr:TetR/AcrR family transcriptional regulator [Hyphomicrobiaceae bacterium]
MPKLKPDIQRARRDHILDAAEQCFARAGFHRTTIQDICRQAGISPGALYVYFDSKEALIAGICERDRAEFSERLAALADAPDFLSALQELGEHYFVHQPVYKSLLCLEIGMESTRNPRIGEIHRSVDEFIRTGFERLFQRLKDERRIAPEMDIPSLARMMAVIGDGLFSRRAVDPGFDGRAMVPATVQVVAALLKSVRGTATTSGAGNQPSGEPT